MLMIAALFVLYYLLLLLKAMMIAAGYEEGRPTPTVAFFELTAR